MIKSLIFLWLIVFIRFVIGLDKDEISSIIIPPKYIGNILKPLFTIACNLLYLVICINIISSALFPQRFYYLKVLSAFIKNIIFEAVKFNA